MATIHNQKYLSNHYKCRKQILIGTQDKSVINNGKKRVGGGGNTRIIGNRNKAERTAVGNTHVETRRRDED